MPDSMGPRGSVTPCADKVLDTAHKNLEPPGHKGVGRNPLNLVEENCNPVHPGWIRTVARITRAGGELAQVGIRQDAQYARWEVIRLTLGIGNDFSIAVGGREQMGIWAGMCRELASRFVKLGRVKFGKIGEVVGAAHLGDCAAH